MTELGTRLKEARIAKGYSLDDLQEVTKIQKRYLIAIEEGNYSIMPGSFYVRAFIKQYAEAVGLDYDSLAEEFNTEIPKQPKEEVAQSISNIPTRRRFRSASTSRLMESLPKMIFVLFIIVIIGVIWFLYQQKADDPNDTMDNQDSQIQYDKKDIPEKKVEKEDKTKTDKEDETSTNEEGKTDEENTDNEATEDETTTQTISDGEVTGLGTIYQVSGIDTLKVRIELSGDSWIDARDKSRASLVESKTYKAGETLEIDATESKYARIRLGNILNAKIFVNNEQIQPVQNKTTQNLIFELTETEQTNTTTQTTETQTEVQD